MSVQQKTLDRGIEHLYHFTSIENLMSIMERGFVYSRQKVDELKLANDGYFTGDYVEHMDDDRFDGLRNYVNLSLSRPNWYLLNKYQQRQELSHLSWCILCLDTQPMFEDSTLFSVCNAASTTAKRYGICGGDIGFERMFMPDVVTPSKTYSRRNLSQLYTTDIQAEVLVKDAIVAQCIKTVFVPSQSKLNQHQAAFKILNLKSDIFSVNQELFSNPILR
ncbi:DarT ssDNA thymidine ADP-ribosyltransferase family protein [Shewanella sp. AC91-MNA-CIBAN-0169]|uniref:DarT ssDNA thymidine ADP-ribosyltransferase family protein n=1 Tax=Shewanella sp. AC91-MNA-CIBAN-0169 TaxID=3140466 RepID=UPI003333C9C6